MHFQITRKTLRHSALACALSLPFVACLGAESLCSTRENVFFSCAIEDRMISVCASERSYPKAGYIQFRYGNGKKLEAAWPPVDSEHKGISKGGLIYHGKLGTYLRFNIDTDAFIVFSLPGDENGLIIVVDGAIQAKRTCDQSVVNNLADIPVPVAALFAVTGNSTH